MNTCKSSNIKNLSNPFFIRTYKLVRIWNTHNHYYRVFLMVYKFHYILWLLRLHILNHHCRSILFQFKLFIIFTFNSFQKQRTFVFKFKRWFLFFVPYVGIPNEYFMVKPCRKQKDIILIKCKGLNSHSMCFVDSFDSAWNCVPKDDESI